MTLNDMINGIVIGSSSTRFWFQVRIPAACCSQEMAFLGFLLWRHFNFSHVAILTTSPGPYQNLGAWLIHLACYVSLWLFLSLSLEQLANFLNGPKRSLASCNYLLYKFGPSYSGIIFQIFASRSSTQDL